MVIIDGVSVCCVTRGGGRARRPSSYPMSPSQRSQNQYDDLAGRLEDSGLAVPHRGLPGR